MCLGLRCLSIYALQQPIQCHPRDEDAPSDPDARNLAQADCLVGGGTGDAEDLGCLLHGHRQAVDWLLDNRPDRSSLDPEVEPLGDLLSLQERIGVLVPPVLVDRGDDADGYLERKLRNLLVIFFTVVFGYFFVFLFVLAIVLLMLIVIVITGGHEISLLGQRRDRQRSPCSPRLHDLQTGPRPVYGRHNDHQGTTFGSDVRYSRRSATGA